MIERTGSPSPRREPAGAGPEQVARRFYDAFIHGRVDEMEALYAPDVHFEDAVFEYRDRAGTMKMWRKLQGAKIEFRFDRVEGEIAIGPGLQPPATARQSTNAKPFAGFGTSPPSRNR